MGGSSRGFITMTAVNCRVAAQPTYYPAHSKNGNNVDQRIVVRSVVNIPSKANGGNGETIGLNIVAWGKLADVLARSMGEGKEFSCELRPNVYKGQAYFKRPGDQFKNLPAVPVTMTIDGVAYKVEVEKTSYRIMKIAFGADSAKKIADEIRDGLRPEGWNIPGSPAAAQWKTMLDKRNSAQYVPGSAVFGHAAVRVIEGPNIGAFDATKARGQAVSTAAAVAAAVAQAPAQAPAPAPVQVPSTAVVAGL